MVENTFDFASLKPKKDASQTISSGSNIPNVELQGDSSDEFDFAGLESSLEKSIDIASGFGAGSLPPFFMGADEIPFPDTELRQTPSVFASPGEFHQRVIKPGFETAISAAKFTPAGLPIAAAEGVGGIGREALRQTFPESGLQPFTPKEALGKALEVGGELIGGKIVDDVIQGTVKTKLLKQTLQSGGAGFLFGAGGSLQQNNNAAQAFSDGLKSAAITAPIPLAFKTGAFMQSRIFPTMNQLKVRVNDIDARRKKFVAEILPESLKEGEQAVGFDFTRTINEASEFIQKADSFDQIEVDFLNKMEQVGSEVDNIINKTSNPKVGEGFLMPLFEEATELSKDAQFKKEASKMWEILTNEITNMQNSKGYDLLTLQQRKKFWNIKLGDLAGSTDEGAAVQKRAFDLLRKGSRSEVANTVASELGEKVGNEVHTLNATFGGLSDAAVIARKQKTKVRTRPTPTTAQKLVGILKAPFSILRGAPSFDDLSRIKRIDEILETRTAEITKLRKKSEAIQKKIQKKLSK